MRTSFGKPPSSYKSMVKILHWSVAALAVLILALGNVALLKWALISCVVIWYAGFAAYGFLSRASPALTGIARHWFLPAHIIMAGLPGILAITLYNAPLGALTGNARTLVIGILGAGLLHGVFHLWRHTSLGDGALRNMLPKFMHGVL